ncbi:MAG TPA: hypothetical protein VFF32_09155 [Dermatophilaceae bacterium]|nr:hypothetical protein [Dermatophilaceae bacterium]
MSKSASGAAVSRRAPRLGPGESIAGHITRRGRFKAIDPRKGRPLPTVARWFAVVGWALLLEESLRRARAASRQ